MKCNCKLKEKLKKSEEKRIKYLNRSKRLKKIMANREGSMLRIFNDTDRETLYVTYNKSAEYTFEKGHHILFIHKGEFSIIPCTHDNNPKEVLTTWEENGSKISKETAIYFGKEYMLNNKAELCEVTYKGLFKKKKVLTVCFSVPKEIKEIDWSLLDQIKSKC